jgi:hypothetical protein
MMQTCNDVIVEARATAGSCVRSRNRTRGTPARTDKCGQSIRAKEIVDWARCIAIAGLEAPRVRNLRM